jgi:hypothetical protein
LTGEKVSDETKKQPLPLWRRIALSIIVLIMIGMAGMMVAGVMLEKKLGGTIKSISESGQPVSFSELAGDDKEIPVEKDAGAIYTAVIFRQGVEDLKNILQVIQLYRNALTIDAVDKLPKELQTSVAQSLTNFRPFMTNMDKAAAFEMSGFDIGIKNGGAVCTQRLQQAQKTLSFMSLRSLFLIGSKDYDRAAKSIVSMLRGARVFDTYPTLTVSTTKQFFLRLACDDIRLLMKNGDVSDEMLDMLIASLNGAASGTGIQKTLLAEQVFQIEATRNIIPESVSLTIMDKDIPELPERVALPGSSRGKIRMRLFVLDYFKEMNGLIASADEGWPGVFDYAVENQKKVPAKLEKHLSGPFTYVQLAAGSITAVRETLVMLNVEKFRRLNNGLPESLDQMTGGQEADILMDPYTGGRLVYRKEEGSYIIYSTGPDKVDNGGDISGKVSETTGKIEKMPEDVGLRMID